VKDAPLGVQGKAQSAAIVITIASICNAAMRVDGVAGARAIGCYRPLSASALLLLNIPEERYRRNDDP
jgi:hypothetical protein